MPPMTTLTASPPEVQAEAARCPYFGPCGGCLYQDRTYESELLHKEAELRSLFIRELGLQDLPFSPMVPSPNPYEYRHRLDLTMKKTREGLLMGFQQEGRRNIIPIESCAISRSEVSNFIPELIRQATARWPEGYRTANLVVKTCDDHRVVWGGIGRRSLEMPEQDYLWTEIHGRKIHYSLDTFFQANLGMLPRVMDKIKTLVTLDPQTAFLDLYAGVGLFGIYFAAHAGAVHFIEDCTSSLKVLSFNIRYHHLKNARLYPGKVEEVLPGLLQESPELRKVALVDPPRRGLHAAACQTLAEAQALDHLLYLSCNPESLVRDLKVFLQAGWKLEHIVPFDFFPRTRHLETLVSMRP